MLWICKAVASFSTIRRSVLRCGGIWVERKSGHRVELTTDRRSCSRTQPWKSHHRSILPALHSFPCHKEIYQCLTPQEPFLATERYWYRRQQLSLSLSWIQVRARQQDLTRDHSCRFDNQRQRDSCTYIEATISQVFPVPQAGRSTATASDRDRENLSSTPPHWDLHATHYHYTTHSKIQQSGWKEQSKERLGIM